MRTTESPKRPRSMSSRLRLLATGLVLSGLLVPATVLGTATTAAAETSVIGGPGSFAQPGIVNLSRTGYTGTRSWLDYQYCIQWAGASTGTLKTASFFAYRAPAYSSSRQTITMHVRLDYWDRSSSSWRRSMWHPNPQMRTTLPGDYPRFDSRSFTVSSGYIYRVVHVFTWSVGGQVVGQTYDMVNADTIFRAGSNGYVISNTGSAAGFCAFVR